MDIEIQTARHTHTHKQAGSKTKFEIDYSLRSKISKHDRQKNCLFSGELKSAAGSECEACRR